MKTFSLLLMICFLLNFSAIAQTDEITALRKQLIEMGAADQKHRKEIDDLDDKIAGASGAEKEQLEARAKRLEKEQDEIDKKLMQQLEAIITKHGWPTISLVGKDAAFYAFLVLQHAAPDHQKKHFPLLKEAAAKNEANKSNIASLEDRILVRDGKKQIYGSQLRFNEQTKKLELFPMEDEENVDARRASVGLKPLKEYLKSFNLEYTPPKKKE